MVNGCVRSTSLAFRGSNYGHELSTAMHGMTSGDKSECPARCLHGCVLASIHTVCVIVCRLVCVLC